MQMTQLFAVQERVCFCEGCELERMPDKSLLRARVKAMGSTFITEPVSVSGVPASRQPPLSSPTNSYVSPSLPHRTTPSIPLTANISRRLPQSPNSRVSDSHKADTICDPVSPLYLHSPPHHLVPALAPSRYEITGLPLLPPPLDAPLCDQGSLDRVISTSSGLAVTSSLHLPYIPGPPLQLNPILPPGNYGGSGMPSFSLETASSNIQPLYVQRHLHQRMPTTRSKQSIFNSVELMAQSSRSEGLPADLSSQGTSPRSMVTPGSISTIPESPLDDNRHVSQSDHELNHAACPSRDMYHPSDRPGSGHRGSKELMHEGISLYFSIYIHMHV